MLKFIAVVIMLTLQLALASTPTSSYVKFIPEKHPMVAMNDMEYIWGNKKIVIQGAWYTFNYTLTNNSPHRLYVKTFHFEARGTRYIIDPNEFCAPGMRRDYIAIVEPGETFRGLAPDHSGALFSRCDFKQRLPEGEFEGLYVQGLPKSENMIYNVKITAEGWFEDVKTNAFVDRFTASGFQQTR